MAYVELRGIKKHFGSVRAVDGVDLTISDGEFLVLLGPSGSGKTTLMRLCAGLEKPTEGKILIDNEEVNDVPPRERGIAMVFQSYALYPHKTVFKNIAFPLTVEGRDKSEIREKVEWAAGLLGIGRLLERMPSQISGGEKQRVAIARARNTGMKVFQDSRIIDRGKAPVVMEPVKATIRIDRPGKATVYVLDNDGVRTDRTLPVQDNQCTIDTARDKTPYYLIAYAQ